MTDAEKLKMLKAMTGEADEEVLSHLPFLSPEARFSGELTPMTIP